MIGQRLDVEGLIVELSPLDRVTAERLQQWRHLERHAADPNAFLSSRFVLPARRHLLPETAPQLLSVERARGGDDALLALAVVEPHGPDSRLPFTYLAGFRSMFSFVGGSLLRRGEEREAVEALCAFVTQPDAPWSGIELPRACAGHDLPAFLPAHRLPGGCRWVTLESLARPVLPLGRRSEATGSGLTGRRGKELRRKWRRLAELGEVSWRCVRGRDIDEPLIEDFLDLEHRGWKGEEGTSLRAAPTDEHFFREMLASFAADDEAFFTVLALDGQPLSITCNLISGPRAFAFKLGWNPDYARYSPAVLNIAELTRQASDLLPDLDMIDSCATSGGFADNLWSARRSLQSCCLTTRRRAHIAYAARELAAALLRRSA